MAKGFKHGGGGGSNLNFNVVAYATADELNAAAPKDNTIGVITQSKITGWVFDSVEPEALEEGELWFATTEISEAPFNALKKNAIMVYVTTAKHFIGGALTDVTAKLRKNGEWVGFDPKLWLFKSGDECLDVTGGWVGTKGDGYISFGGAGSSNNAYTQNTISAAGYSKMYIEYELTNTHGSGNGNINIYLADRQSNAYVTNYAQFGVLTKDIQIGVRYTGIIDVSNVTQPFYIKGSGWYGSGNIYNIWMVP